MFCHTLSSESACAYSYSAHRAVRASRLTGVTAHWSTARTPECGLLTVADSREVVGAWHGHIRRPRPRGRVREGGIEPIRLASAAPSARSARKFRRWRAQMSFLRGTRAESERMECAHCAHMRRRAGLAMTCAAGTILSHWAHAPENIGGAPIQRNSCRFQARTR